jgi:uncharacterized protein YceH (UPF0502 family)
MLPNDLSPVEVRVVGSLIEKELSTPDHYPLSLNALAAACNQSSNRDPVMSLDEGTIAPAIDALRRRGLVRSIQGIGSRVPKYQHLLADAGDLTRTELAVVAVLALRGPQTHAEIRSRSARLVTGGDAGGIDAALEALVTRDPPVVRRLARRPGQKEARYAHLMSGDVAEPADETGAAALDLSGDRVASLEDEVRTLREEIAQLRAQVSDFRRQFE